MILFSYKAISIFEVHFKWYYFFIKLPIEWVNVQKTRKVDSKNMIFPMLLPRLFFQAIGPLGPICFMVDQKMASLFCAFGWLLIGPLTLLPMTLSIMLAQEKKGVGTQSTKEYTTKSNWQVYYFYTFLYGQ